MAITVNTKTPIAITVSSVGSGNSPYTKERNPHRGGGGGHFAPASTGKFMSNERRLEIENERLREALKGLLDATDQFVFQENYPLAVKKAKAALKEGE
jgi:hypothetical protein